MSIGGIGGIGYGCGFPSLGAMRQAMFKRMDVNGDGVIDAGECQTLAGKISEKTGLSISASEMMSIFDLDQDGVITRAEQDKAGPVWKQHLKDLLDAAGKAPKGEPSPPDAARDLFKLVDRIFQAMDTNGDGKVDQSEYETALQQILGFQEGSSANNASTGSTDATTAAAGSDTGADSQNTLAALVRQLLQDIINYENNLKKHAGSQEQDPQRINSYA